MESPRHIVVVSSLVRDKEGKVLLIRHYKRGWEVPQGRVEEGESLTEALHREVREETGVDIVAGPLAVVWSKLSPPAAVIFTFLAEYAGGELAPSEESPEIRWFEPEEAIGMVNHPVNSDRLKALLDYSGDVLYRSYESAPYRIVSEAAWG